MGLFKKVFRKASTTDIETSYSKTHRLQVKMAGFGKQLYNLFTNERGTGKQRLNQSLPKEIRDSRWHKNLLIKKMRSYELNDKI